MTPRAASRGAPPGPGGARCGAWARTAPYWRAVGTEAGTRNVQGATMRRTTKAGVTMISAAALVLAACGDVPTEDRRGYTKAPLEDPGLTITSEGKTEVSEFAQ